MTTHHPVKPESDRMATTKVKTTKQDLKKVAISLSVKDA
jgi:hypothetical protein